jgi:hypothetical protein
MNQNPLQVEETILLEEFSNDTFPPDGWDTEKNNPNGFTWERSSHEPKSDPYCAICNRDPSKTHQNEWLITPGLDFSLYNEVFCELWWRMNCYAALPKYENSYDLNISVSIDNGPWIWIWNENHLEVWTDGYDWKESNYDTGEDINLSDYAGESNVRIGFQYNGKDAATMGIDDIEIYGIRHGPTPLVCDAGGPYKGCVLQEICLDEAIVEGGTKPYSYHWSLGDGNFNNASAPCHIYEDLKDFDVKLTVRDFSGLRAEDNTTVNISKCPDLPEIEIVDIKGSLLSGVKAKLINYGGEAKNVEWELDYNFILLGIFNGDKDGEFEVIAENEERQIQSDNFIGWGRFNVKITVEAENLPEVTEERGAFKIGTLTIIKGDVW